MKIKIKIPNRVKILDQIIKVIWDQTYLEQLQATGASEFDYNRIVLCDSYDYRRLPKSMIEKTFFHELAHFLIYQTGYQKLAIDEKFITILGAVLYNLMLNNKFHEEEKNESKTKS